LRMPTTSSHWYKCASAVSTSAIRL
jgi:hypothetical protein